MADYTTKDDDNKKQTKSLFVSNTAQRNFIQRSGNTKEDETLGAEESIAPEPSGIPKHIDRYKVVKVLGEGGRGIVYQAYDPVLKRQIALKLNAQAADVYDLLAELAYQRALAVAQAQSPLTEIKQGLESTSKALTINPEDADGLVVQAKLLLLQAAQVSVAERRGLATQAKTSLEAAIKKNPLLEKDNRTYLTTAAHYLGDK